MPFERFGEEENGDIGDFAAGSTRSNPWADQFFSDLCGLGTVYDVDFFSSLRVGR